MKLSFFFLSIYKRYLHLDFIFGAENTFEHFEKLHFCLSIYILSPPHVSAVNKFSNLLHFLRLDAASDLAIWLALFFLGS